MNPAKPKLVRFGPDQEQLVRLYKLSPSTEILETIIDCCSGLCVYAYSSTKPGVPYLEFWQEAFKDIQRAIDDFDPDRGKFSSWITFRFLKAGQSVRHRRIKHWKKFLPTGLTLPNPSSTPAKKYNSMEEVESIPVWYDTPGNPNQDPATIYERKSTFESLGTVLKQNRLRFTTSPESEICQYVLDYLISNQAWPHVAQVVDSFHTLGVGKVLASRLLIYLKMVCMRTLEVQEWEGATCG